MTHRLHRDLAILLLLSTSAPLARSQAPGEAGPTRSPGPRVPARTIVGELPTGPPELPGRGVDRGEPILEPFHAESDAVPLPGRPAYSPGPLGDERVAEAHGDPFFLGFVAGSYHPPAGELVDPDLARRVLEPAVDGRPEEVTYAYVMLAERLSPDLLSALEDVGVRPISFRPHQSFSIAVGPETLSSLAAWPAVRWVGFARPWQKVHPALVGAMQGVAPGARLPIVVSVFDDDRGAASVSAPVAMTEVAGPGVRRTGGAFGARWSSNGWQHTELAKLGVEVVEYLPRARAFRVRASAAEVAALVERDFVEFLEPEVEAVPAHDDSMPMIGADYVRQLVDGGSSGEAIAGEIDTGMDIAHTALNHVWTLGWGLTGTSPWLDTCAHGSHVAGSILALPGGALELTGAAPGLGQSPNRSFRHVKGLDFGGGGTCVVLSSQESMFSLMRDTWSDGEVESPKPHVVNNSWGSLSTPGGWSGTEAAARSVDAEVWNEDQVYVFVAHNWGPGPSTVCQQGSAKNALTVGNVVPQDAVGVGGPGTLWPGSSIGPTADDRWKPNVVAPGRQVVSADAHTGSGFAPGTGTSMAAPHVTGVVAQLVDRHPALRYRPERIASLLMATAHTKGDVALTSSTSGHLDTYGAGRVDAYRANFVDSQHGWLNWGFPLGAKEQAWEEFEVSGDVERIVVVMHYVEPAASAGASQALVNDFDLVLDFAPFSNEIWAGDYYSHQSSRDNTEIRAIDDPKPGAWRWKVHPLSASSSVKMSVTVHFIEADTTPEGGLALEADDVYVQPGDDVTITATVGNTEHVASGILVDTTDDAGANLIAATTRLLDGTVADLMDNPVNDGGWEATAGNLRHGWTREVEWVVDWVHEGVKTFAVDADSDNGMNLSATVDVTVDGTPPSIPGNLQSSSHLPNTWYRKDEVHFVWDPAPDNLSGIGGYGVYASHGPDIPAAVQDLGPVKLTVEKLATSSNGWYFNQRAVDRSGNWGIKHATAGPYFIDTVDPGTVTDLVSTSHPTGTWVDDPEIVVEWTAADDAHSGLAGYGEFWSTGAPFEPSETQDLGAVTTSSSVFASSHSPRYYNIRSLDVAGNWDEQYRSAGPYFVDVDAPIVDGVSFHVGGVEVDETPTAALTVEVDASDLHSGPDEVRLQNVGGSWSAWQPYSSSVDWNLGTGVVEKLTTGTKTVLVQVRDRAGNLGQGEAAVYFYRPAVPFGSACGGAMGLPTIDVEGIAEVGGTVEVAVGNTDAALRRLVLGFSKTEWAGFSLPLELAFFGAPGCQLLVSQDLEVYSGPASQAALEIPDDADLVGLELHLQWQLFGDSGGLPVVLTEGLTLYVNGP